MSLGNQFHLKVESDFQILQVPFLDFVVEFEFGFGFVVLVLVVFGFGFDFVPLYSQSRFQVAQRVEIGR